MSPGCCEPTGVCAAKILGMVRSESHEHRENRANEKARRLLTSQKTKSGRGLHCHMAHLTNTCDDGISLPWMLVKPKICKANLSVYEG